MMGVFVDTSRLIALAASDDELHSRALAARTPATGRRGFEALLVGG